MPTKSALEKSCEQAKLGENLFWGFPTRYYKPRCTATEDAWKLEISVLETRVIVLYMKQRSRPAPLFIPHAKSRSSYDSAHMIAGQ